MGVTSGLSDFLFRKSLNTSSPFLYASIVGLLRARSTMRRYSLITSEMVGDFFSGASMALIIWFSFDLSMFAIIILIENIRGKKMNVKVVTGVDGSPICGLRRVEGVRSKGEG